MKPTSLFLLSFTLFLSSCFPAGTKEEIDKSMTQGLQMFADDEFKKAIGYIELYKLRNGEYPSSLKDLQFLSLMDSSMLTHVRYNRLDTVYELNMNYSFPGFGNSKSTVVKLKYPEEFWKGTGCVKSNTK